jgi:hypothetical protein
VDVYNENMLLVIQQFDGRKAQAVIYLVQWKEGRISPVCSTHLCLRSYDLKIAQLRALNTAGFKDFCPSPRFLAPKIFIIPHLEKGTLELCELREVLHTSSSQSGSSGTNKIALYPIAALKLPSLKKGVRWTGIHTFLSSPEPSSTVTPSPTNTRFSSSPLHSILSFELTLAKGKTREDVTLLCVIHRHTILQHALDALADPAIIQKLQHVQPPPAHRALVPIGYNGNIQPLPPCAPDVVGAAISIPWQHWGCEKGWFKLSSTESLSDAIGQRLVEVILGEAIIVRDFNANNVRRAAASPRWNSKTSLELQDGTTVRIVDKYTPCNYSGWFTEKVVAGLPCLESTMPIRKEFIDIIADEDRIIGVTREACLFQSEFVANVLMLLLL